MEVLVTISIIGILSLIAIEVGGKAKQREQINALAIPLAGWLEQVRKASLLGAGCTATVYRDISAGSMIAKATITNSGSGITRTTCVPSLVTADIDSITRSTVYSISSGANPTSFTQIRFTPRGTVDLPADQNSINLIVKLLPKGPSRCISIKHLIANISITRENDCGVQQTF